MRFFNALLPPIVIACCALTFAGSARAGVAAAIETGPFRTVPADIATVPKGTAEVARSAAPDTMLTVDLLLKARVDAAAEYARRVSTPGDPLVGRFLTPAQFGDTFGASRSDYDAVVAWARRNGLTVHEASVGRTILSVTARASQIENAFRVHLRYYRSSDGKILPATAQAPSMPADIAARLTGVTGLSKRIQYAPLVRIRPAAVPAPKIDPAVHGVAPDSTSGTGPGGAFSPGDFRTAYSVPTPALRGPSETLAVFEQGGFFASDVAKFVSQYKLPAVPVVVRNVNGYGGGVDDPNVELEAVLDIDTLIGINPGAARVLVYEDGDDYLVAMLDSLTAIANDDKASIVSISYGIDEAESGSVQIAAENRLFVQLAAQGQTVFVSSGDQGAYGRSGEGLNASDPGAQPFVTSVGGTMLLTHADQSYAYEHVWNDLGRYYGASGGGVSSHWALPKYQLQPLSTPVVSVAANNGGSNTHRNFPDVSADADPFTGASVYAAIDGGWLQLGGTSLSAPLYAGYASLYDQLHQIAGLGHIGFLNPAIYGLGTTLGGYYSYHDVRDGNNGFVGAYGISGFNAGYDFDDTTGWGSPNGVVEMQNLLTNALPQTKPPAAAKHVVGTLSKGTATISWAAAAGATGYEVLVFDSSTNDLVTARATTGTQNVLTGLPGSTYLAFYVLALSPHGSTYSPGLYLYSAGTNARPPVLLDSPIKN